MRQNEVSFGRYTRVILNNTESDRAPPTEMGNLRPEPAVCSDAAYRQITLALVIITVIRQQQLLLLVYY